GRIEPHTAAEGEELEAIEGDSISAADRGLAVAGDVPGESESRSPLIAGFVDIGDSADGGVHCALEDIAAGAEDLQADQSISLGGRGVAVPAHADVERQPPGDPPVVLHKQAVVLLAIIARRADRDRRAPGLARIDANG